MEQEMTGGGSRALCKEEIQVHYDVIITVITIRMSRFTKIKMSQIATHNDQDQDESRSGS